MRRLRSPQRLLAALLAAAAAFVVIPEMHAATAGAGHHASILATDLPENPQLAGAGAAHASDDADLCPLCLAMGQARSVLAQTPGVRDHGPQRSHAALPARPDAHLPGDPALCDASPRAPPTSA